jgi:hypothetical protein
MDEKEEAFINAFVARDRRDRWRTMLASEDRRRRTKQLHRLAHVFHEDPDPRFVYPKESPPPEVAAQVKKTLAQWAESNPHQLCHVIACSSTADGTEMVLSDAEASRALTCGAVLLLIPNRLAYYHPERDGVSMQPRLLLFRPG